MLHASSVRSLAMGLAIALHVGLGLGLVAGSALQAQDRFAVFSTTAGTKRASLLEMDDAGRIVRTIATFASDFAPQDVVMAADNRSFRVVGIDPFNTPGPQVLEVSPTGAIRTIASGFPMITPTRILADTDGSYIILDRVPGGTSRILRLGASGTFRSITNIPLIAYGAIIDPTSGRIVVRANAANTFPPSNVVGYFGVDIGRGTVTTVVTARAPARMDAQYGAHEFIYRPGHDDFVDAIYDQGILAVELHGVAPGTLTPITEPLFLQFPMDLERTSDRSLPTRYRVFTRHMSVPVAYQLIRVKDDGNPLTSVLYPASADFEQNTPLMRIGNRHLAWSGAGTARRRLAIDVAAEPGRAYAVGLSLTGIGTGVALGDGRTIPITPDALTGLALQNAIPGLVNGATGALDANGRAALTIDTTAVGRLGISLWAAAVVLDPNAPAGVAEVLGPTRVRLF